MVSESTKAAITKHRNWVASEEFHFLIVLEAPKSKIQTACVSSRGLSPVHTCLCVSLCVHIFFYKDSGQIGPELALTASFEHSHPFKSLLPNTVSLSY